MIVPDLRLLATFLAVHDARSMAEAAERLGYVPSAVSQQISALEHSLGVELFVRKPGRRTALTASGRALERAVRTLFVATAEYQDIATQVSLGQVAEIRIGAFPTAMSRLIPPVVASITKQHTGIQIRLVEVETPPGLPMVRNGDIDLLLAYRYLPEDPPSHESGCRIISLGDEPLILTTQRGKNLTLHDCAELNWVAGYQKNGDNRLLHRWTHRFGFVPRVPFETPDAGACLALIEAGLAVGLLPAMMVRQSLSAGRVEPIPLPAGCDYPSRELLAVTRLNHASPVIDLVLAELRFSLQDIVVTR